MDPNYNKTPVFDEDNIRTYEYPFGEMAREILDLTEPITTNNRLDQPPQIIIDLADLGDNSWIASNEETAASIPITSNLAESKIIDEAIGSSQQLLHKQLLDYMMNQLQPFGIIDPDEKRIAITTAKSKANNFNDDEGIAVNSQQMQYLQQYMMQLQSFGLNNPNENVVASPSIIISPSISSTTQQSNVNAHNNNMNSRALLLKILRSLEMNKL